MFVARQLRHFEYSTSGKITRSDGRSNFLNALLTTPILSFENDSRGRTGYSS